MSTAQLRREVPRLREHRPPRRRVVAEDRLEFADSLGIVPDTWQERLLLSEAPRVLVNCARQTGKSTTGGVLILHEALARPGSLALILAPAERQAKELFGKVAEGYHALGHAVPAESYRKLGMELSNGSRIEALPGMEKTIRGFSGVDLLIVDEASRVADELYYAVRPMLAVSGGRLMMLSTPSTVSAGRSSLRGPGERAGSATRSPPRSVHASRHPSSRRRGGRFRRGFTVRSTSAPSRRPKTRFSLTNL